MYIYTPGYVAAYPVLDSVLYIYTPGYVSAYPVLDSVLYIYTPGYVAAYPVLTVYRTYIPQDMLPPTQF